MSKEPSEHLTATRLASRKDALQTFTEQTKLLVSLASGFVLAPPAFLALGIGKEPVLRTAGDVGFFIAIESLQILSVFFGYITIACVAGSQDRGDYDVYRTATRRCSGFQIAFYIMGIVCFVIFAMARLTASASTAAP